MEIYVEKSSGFCFGVRMAVNATEKALKEKTEKIVCTYGALIHNSQEVNRLSSKGLKIIDSLDEINGDDKLVIIRSHGTTKKAFDFLNKMKFEYIDCTCPFVSRIHKIVSENYDAGYKILIVGDKNHPEVVGINGWCNNTATAVLDENMIDSIPIYDKVCLVAQTTITSDLWEKVVNKTKSRFEIVRTFNTRCNATENRQKAAKELAKNVDAMIVIGGYNSSNTRKLFNICMSNCKNVYHIETSKELDLKLFKNIKKVGITAGASTPDWILKEVLTEMEDMNSENMREESNNDLMEEYEKSLIRLNEGDTVKGTVLSLNDDEVIVNIGYKADGIISKEDLSWNKDIKPSELISVGDEVYVKVVRINDGEGNVVLSKKLVELDKNLQELELVFNDELSIKGQVKEIVKGGGIVEILGLKSFMPASLFDLRYINDLDSFKGKDVNVKIIEFDKDNKKIIVSRKAYVLEEKEKLKEEFWSTAEEGKRIVGEVKRLTDFGAFVDVGGLDGLIHISELSWTRVNHPSEVLKPGDKVEVVILSLDKEKNKVSLGLKQTIPEPWTTIEGKYNIGDLINVKIVRFANFGAFAEIEPGVDGLIHISQISEERITKPSQVLEINQVVKVKIININIQDRKISLSIVDAIEESDKIEEEGELVDFEVLNVKIPTIEKEIDEEEME